MTKTLFPGTADGALLAACAGGGLGGFAVALASAPLGLSAMQDTTDAPAEADVGFVKS